VQKYLISIKKSCRFFCILIDTLGQTGIQFDTIVFAFNTVISQNDSSGKFNIAYRTTDVI